MIVTVAQEAGAQALATPEIVWSSVAPNLILMVGGILLLTLVSLVCWQVFYGGVEATFRAPLWAVLVQAAVGLIAGLGWLGWGERQVEALAIPPPDSSMMATPPSSTSIGELP